MADVVETQLPGVGVRHDFITRAGERVGVLLHRSGRRELLLYDQGDPDACRAVVTLDSDDTRTLAELLGASAVTAALGAAQQQVQGLAIDWITVRRGSSIDGVTLGEAAIRTRTGVSIVAVIRSGATVPSPAPEFSFEPDDVAVAVGTPEGLERLYALLEST
jgi:TrkA domain protein